MEIVNPLDGVDKKAPKSISKHLILLFNFHFDRFSFIPILFKSSRYEIRILEWNSYNNKSILCYRT